MTASLAELKTYANLPEQFPEGTLNAHLASALRDLKRDSAIDEPTDEQLENFKEAQIVKALASATPILNAFYLDGQAGAQSLHSDETSANFFDPNEVEALVNRYEKRYRQLVNILKTDDDDSEVGGIFLGAV